MPRVKVKATKMTDAQVSYLSLVERGANRIPFRIIKEDRSMATGYDSLDLGHIFTVAKADKAQATGKVVAVVTMKGDGLPAVRSLIEKAGFAVSEEVEEEDGAVVFKQEGYDDDDDDDTVLIRLNDQVVLVTKGFRPYDMDMDTSEGSFADNCAANGFYPGIRTIVDVLNTSINRMVGDASSPTDAVSNVSKMFDEAKAYTLAFLRTLPVKAFKLETVDADLAALAVAKSETAQTSTGSDEEEGDGAGKDRTEEEAMPQVHGEEPDTTGLTPDTVKKDDALELTKDDVLGVVKVQLQAAFTDLTKKFETLTNTMTTGYGAVESSVAALGAKVDTLDARVLKAEELATQATTAVQGVVVQGSESEDQPFNVAKREHVTRDFDTAFQPNVRKTARH